MTLYDAVVTSRGLEPFDTANGTLTIDDINKERFKEYIGEGQIWFNMKRQNLPISSYDNKTTFRPENGIYVVPIPDEEKENRN